MAPPAAQAESAEDAVRKAAASGKAALVAAETPLTRCADRNFLTRPMCIYDECQKPEFVKLPLCVENERRIRESRNSRN